VEAKHINLAAGTGVPDDPAERKAAARVREIPLPASALSFSTLRRIDYTDAFLLDCPQAQQRTGEEWARAMLEEAPAATRTMLRRGWFALGVRLGRTDDRRLVLGWAIRERSPDFALLAARSLFGIDAEVLVRREPGALLVATLMQLNNPLARAFGPASPSSTEGSSATSSRSSEGGRRAKAIRASGRSGCREGGPGHRVRRTRGAHSFARSRTYAALTGLEPESPFRPWGSSRGGRRSEPEVRGPE